MDFSQYFVVPRAQRAAVHRLFDKNLIAEEKNFLIVFSEKEPIAKKLDVAMNFHNDEWSAWGFTLFARGKRVAHALFGENAETGVSREDNCLEGDLDEAARLLGVEAKKLRRVVEAEAPDVEEFVKAIGFGRYSLTGYQAEKLLTKTSRRAATKPKKTAKKTAKTKAKTRAKTKAKTRAKTKAKKKAKKKATIR